MLLLGTLGLKNSAERRYKVRTALAAAVLVYWFLFASAIHLRHRVIGATTVLLTAIAMSYIAWEMRRYLSQLDELTRRMQLEALAWTYLTGFVLAAWFGAFLMFAALFSHVLLHWSYKVLLLMSPFMYYVLELVRAGWLYRLSRRY
jgi:hypothetical protein